MGKIKQYFSMQRVLLLALLFVCLAPLSALAQTIQLTGTVTDTKGESLIGASVLEKGTSNGCITDVDGNFTLTVSPKATMVISCGLCNPGNSPQRAEEHQNSIER